MSEIIFRVEEKAEGGFIARALGECIFIESATWDGLETNIREAIQCHFDASMAPESIQILHQGNQIALAQAAVED